MVTNLPATSFSGVGDLRRLAAVPTAGLEKLTPSSNEVAGTKSEMDDCERVGVVVE